MAFDKEEDKFRTDLKPAMRVAIFLKPGRPPGTKQILMRQLAQMRGVGAGTGLTYAFEASVIYDEPNLMKALLDALEMHEDVESYEILEPTKLGGHDRLN